MTDVAWKHESDGGEDPSIFKPQLQKPVPVMRTVKYFMDGLNNGSIDIDPDYQRDVVWPADRMSSLINSLMENYYVPPIILNRKRVMKKHVHMCVDGKQRLTSVKRFIQGDIPCRDHDGEKWFFTDNNSTKQKKNILPEEIQNEFWTKDFVSIEYCDIFPEQEEDLFARVQMGMPLTPAEKLRASSGPWQELTRRYLNDFPAIYQLLKDVSHARDFAITMECFTQIMEVQQNRPSNDKAPVFRCTVIQATKLANAYKDELDDATKSHMARVWTTFQELVDMDPITFNNADKHLHGVQTFAPLEMVATTVLISMYVETRSNRVLLEYVRAMRTALREEYKELRISVEAWKSVWRWLSRPPHYGNSNSEQEITNTQNVAMESARRPRANLLALRQHGLATQKSNNSIPDATKDRPTKKRRIGSKAAICPSPELPPTSTDDFSTAQDILPVSSTSARKTRVPSKRMSTELSSKSPQAQPSLPLTPSEVRQNRISELNSYRAPLAPMGQVSPFTSVGPHARQKENQAPTMSRRKIIQIETPSTQSKSNSPTIPHLDGTVDEMHDNGRERETGPELWASFCSRTVGKRQQRTVSEQSPTWNDIQHGHTVSSTGKTMARRRIIDLVS
ncbi:unnamed protein product [Periconia digitata]|uniref:GmrSD restriction endonucleases N-terminal domain-containing protein n=1 Tax=Periconia digitata TaxID=1303443 RepID=A0A9W4XPX4_9PLEO|nr:unnamed protein product [Periconia digitata]